MWLRQMIRYFRSPSRIIGAIAQPLFYMIVFSYGFGSVFRMAGQDDYLSFLAPGIVGMTILFSSIFSGIELIFDRQFGFLKETLAAPVSRLNVMIGRTAGGATISTVQGVLVLAVAFALGFRPESWQALLPAIGAMFLVALIFTALGTWIASGLSDFQGFQLIMNFLVMPMFLLSGALFPLTGLPPALKLAAFADPLTYGVDALRALLVGASQFGLALNAAILFALCALVLVGGSRAFSRIQA
jgi:ABC-2 type transport system permease protein